VSPLIGALAVPPVDGARIAVAFSGGGDSTALLHAAAAVHGAAHMHALHVCHHLQPQSEDWATHCANVCRGWGIEFTRLDVRVDSAGDGMEAGARQARYAALSDALAEHGLLAVAHHAEDQAETFLSQALRGAGVHGLASMPVVAALGAGWLWRPWLALPRQTIVDYLTAHKLTWIEDPSNQDPAIGRGYLRRKVWPALSGRWPAAATTLSRSARWAAQAAEAIDALAAIDLEQARAPQQTLRLAALARLSPARTSQLLRRWLADVHADPPDHRHLDQIQRLCAARVPASARVVFADTEVRAYDGYLFAMRRLAVPPAGRLAWNGHTRLTLPGDAGQLSVQKCDARGTGSGGAIFQVGFRQGGEWLATGRGSGRLLKDWFTDRRVPPWQRERVPLIYAGKSLLAVGDLWAQPAANTWPGGVPRVFIWRHSLPGMSSRVVDGRPLG
jgi:tRNA(Ile)-lysidine synthase